MAGPIIKPLVKPQTIKIGRQTTVENAPRKPPSYVATSGLKRPAEEYLTRENHKLDSSGFIKPPLEYAAGPALGKATNGVRLSAPPTVEPFMKASRFHATRSDPRLKASTIMDAVESDEKNGPSYYSQRKAFACTPTPTNNPLLSLSHPAYGLPPDRKSVV